MFMNCMCTGNLMAMFYPLSVLLYALIEDPRPRSNYWSMILIYAEFVILFKFLIQQNALTVLTPGSLFVEIVDKYKLGFRVFDKKEYARGIFSFIIWDILVALSVLLHQHCLVLMGLWKKRECDYETIDQAKARLNAHIRRDPIFEQRIPKSPERPLTILEVSETETPDKKVQHHFRPHFINENNEYTDEDVTSEKRDNAKRQSIRRDQSLQLPRTNFGNLEVDQVDTRMAKVVTVVPSNDMLSEDSSFIEEENFRYSANYFIHEYSSDTDIAEPVSCEARIRLDDSESYSAVEFSHYDNSENNIKYYANIDDEGIIGMRDALLIDYYEENPELLNERNKLTFRKLVIENDFILRIFPTSSQEKPGVDMYNYGVVFQFLNVVYLLFFFSQMTGEKEELSETFKFKRFRTEMIFFMFIQIMLILLDRFFYISNTYDKVDVEPEYDSEAVKSVYESVIKSQNKHNFIKLMVYIVLVILVHF